MTRDDRNEISSQLARELIQAGRGERASGSAREVALSALAEAGLVAASQTASWGVMVKWLVLSACVVTAGGAAWHTTRGGAELAPAAKHSASQSARARASVMAAVSASSTITARAPSASAEPLPRRKHTPPSKSALPLASSEQPRGDRLRAELDTLAAAREALTRGDATSAAALLDRHTGGFQLLPVEAGIVRVQALGAAGDEQSARRLATSLLRQHASGPYSARLLALLGGAE